MNKQNRKKGIALCSALVLMISFGVRQSDAQCAFEQPMNAKRTTLALVPAFVPCNAGVCINTDGNDGASCGADAECQSSFDPDGICLLRPPNGQTQGGVPSCLPPQTFVDWADGDPDAPPAAGWHFGPKGAGTLSFRAAPNRVAGPSSDPNTADIAVEVDLRDVVDVFGPVDGYGRLVTRVRFTANGRDTGDQTVIEVPISFPVNVTHGKARLRTSYNAFLGSVPQPFLPGCTLMQLMGADLLDENGSLFAQPGLFLPRLN